MFSSSPMLLGQYRPLDSFLHRLDARAKLIPVLLVMVLSLLTQSLLFYVALLVLLGSGLLLSGVGYLAILRNLRPLLMLVGITFLYHIIFTEGGGSPLFSLFGLSVTEETMSRASFFSLRLLLFVAIAFLVTLTSSPSELAESLTKLLRPLEKIKVPVGELGLIMFIAIRFIPVLYHEYETIKNAQMIRGVDFSGHLLSRVRKAVAIFVPVLVGAIGRADELALAMEARGYVGHRHRTFFSRSIFGLSGRLFVAGVSAVVFLLYFVTSR